MWSFLQVLKCPRDGNGPIWFKIVVGLVHLTSGKIRTDSIVTIHYIPDHTTCLMGDMSSTSMRECGLTVYNATQSSIYNRQSVHDYQAYVLLRKCLRVPKTISNLRLRDAV